MEQFGAGEHIERLLIEDIHTAHESGGVEIAAQAVKTAQQRLAITETVERDAIERHVLRAAAAIRLERRMRDTEIARLARARPRHVTHLRCEANERRHRRVHTAFELGNDGPHRRPATRRLTFRAAAGEALEGIMAAVAVGQRADERAFVHHFRETRQVLADLDAGDVGGDGFELATDLARRVGLHVEHVLVRRAAWQEDHDRRLVRLARFLRRLSAQHIIQRQPTHGESADIEEVSTRDAVAETAAGFGIDG